MCVGRLDNRESYTQAPELNPTSTNSRATSQLPALGVGVPRSTEDPNLGKEERIRGESLGSRAGWWERRFTLVILVHSSEALGHVSLLEGAGGAFEAV